MTAAAQRKAAAQKASAANNKQNPPDAPEKAQESSSTPPPLPPQKTSDPDQVRRDKTPNPTRTTLTGAMRNELIEKTGEQVLALLTDLTTAKAAGEFLRKIIAEQGGPRASRGHSLCVSQTKMDLGRLQSHLKLLYDEIY